MLNHRLKTLGQVQWGGEVIVRKFGELLRSLARLNVGQADVTLVLSADRLNVLMITML